MECYEQRYKGNNNLLAETHVRLVTDFFQLFILYIASSYNTDQKGNDRKDNKYIYKSCGTIYKHA